MIVFEDRQLVIITPPHTASGNLHRALCSPAWGGHWAIGPTPDGAGFDHHVSAISEGWKDFDVALVVRHPLDRCIGLYEHHQHAAALNAWQPIEWWQFVRLVLTQDATLSWFYRTTISQLIDATMTQPTRLVRFEHLLSDLEDLLKKQVDLPDAWTADRDHSRYLSAGGVCAMIEEWADSDMQRFGYSSRLTTGEDHR